MQHSQDSTNSTAAWHYNIADQEMSRRQILSNIDLHFEDFLLKQRIQHSDPLIQLKRKIKEQVEAELASRQIDYLRPNRSMSSLQQSVVAPPPPLPQDEAETESSSLRFLNGGIQSVVTSRPVRNTQSLLEQPLTRNPFKSAQKRASKSRLAKIGNNQQREKQEKSQPRKPRLSNEAVCRELREGERVVKIIPPYRPRSLNIFISKQKVERFLKEKQESVPRGYQSSPHTVSHQQRVTNHAVKVKVIPPFRETILTARQQFSRPHTIQREASRQSVLKISSQGSANELMEEIIRMRRH